MNTEAKAYTVIWDGGVTTPPLLTELDKQKLTSAIQLWRQWAEGSKGSNGPPRVILLSDGSLMDVGRILAILRTGVHILDPSP